MHIQVDHSSFIKDVEQIESTINSPQLAVGNICEKYKAIKPLIERILPILRLIPAIGKIATAIEFLMTIADQFCVPGGGAQQ